MAYCALTDLAELGYSWETTDEANITAICETASKSIDTFCRQTFKKKTDQQEKHIVRVRNGLLKVFPLNLTVNNISSIQFVPTVVGLDEFTCSNFIFIPNACYILANTNIANGAYLVNVTYDYGFADGSFPEEIVKATVLASAPLLDDYFLSKDSNVSMIKKLKQGQTEIMRQDTDKLPQNVIDILNGGNNGLGWVRVRAS